MVNSLLWISLLVLSKFRTKLVATNQLIIWEWTKFDNEQKSSIFLLYIMIVVLWANNIGCDTEFILRGRSFMYIMNNGGPRIDRWGTPCFSIP